MKFKYFFKYMKDIVQNTFYKIKYPTPDVLSDEETIQYILKHNCSISRYGDGEMRLMRGVDLEFQVYERELAKKLKEVKTAEKCLVCIPSIFNKEIFNLKNITDKEYYYWKKFKKYRGGLWNSYFKNQAPLGDAFVSRFYLRKRNKAIVGNYIVLLKQLWQDRNILFVEGEQSRLGVGNDLFDNAISIRRILCPPTNSFDKYEEIKDAILKNANKDDLIIMALGPTATVLSYELSPKLQCLDLGHIDIEYEWFKLGVDKKVKIPHKFVNEVSDGRSPEDVMDKNYKEQIINVIK